MALSVLNTTAVTDLLNAGMPGYAYRDRPGRVPRSPTRHGERPVSRIGLDLREWNWPVTMDRTTANALRAFILARGIVADAFLLYDHFGDAQRVDVVLSPVGDGARVTFALPTDELDEEYRYFPVAAGLTAKDNGVAAVVDSVNVDARTVTLTAAPAAGHVVTATYYGMRCVKFDAPPEETPADPGVIRRPLAIVEVLRP